MDRSLLPIYKIKIHGLKLIIVLLVLDISNCEWSKRDIAWISPQLLRGQARLALDSLCLLKPVFI